MYAVSIARVRYDFRGVPILVHSDKTLTLNWQLGPHHRPPHTLGVLSDVLYDVCAETDLIALCLTADRCILRASGLGLAVHVAPQTLDHFMQTLSLYRPEPAWGPCPPGLFRAWRLGLFRKAFMVSSLFSFLFLFCLRWPGFLRLSACPILSFARLRVLYLSMIPWRNLVPPHLGGCPWEWGTAASRSEGGFALPV